MSNTDTLIKIAYEQEGMTPEEIADDQGLEITAVKAKLMQLSVKYRQACNKEDEEDTTLNFDDNQLRIVNQIIFDTACSAERADGTVDWKTRAEAAMYIRDDKKGRKEVRKQIQNTSFNILAINEKLAQAAQVSQQLIKAAIEV